MVKFVRLLFVLAFIVAPFSIAQAEELSGTWVWPYYQGNVTLKITGTDSTGQPIGTYQFQDVTYQIARQTSASEIKVVVNGRTLTMITAGGSTYSLSIGPKELKGRAVSRTGSAVPVVFTRQ